MACRFTLWALSALFVLSCSQENPTAQSVDPHAQGAASSGSDECPTQAFNIQLQFFDNVKHDYRIALQRAANRWESVIRGDLPDIRFLSDPLDEWDSHLKAHVSFRGTVDDLLIIVRVVDLPGDLAASAGVSWIRTQGGLPIVSTIALDDGLSDYRTPAEIEKTMLHEIAHCLGFGTTELWDNFVKEWPATRSHHDPHFDGLFATAMFEVASGFSYSGKKVPIERLDGGHWRFTLGDELMAKGWTYPYRQPLSEITIGALYDMGYNVSWWGAEHYQTPTMAAKAQTDKDGSDTWSDVVRKPVRKR